MGMPHSNLWPVEMDPAQVDQILANLCVNARDAISGVGKVTIETKNAVLDRAGFVESRRICIRGICDADRQRQRVRQLTGRSLPIFLNRFLPLKVRGKGRGWGLSTVYGIVQTEQRVH